MNTKRTKRIFIVRAATMLLMMLLTSTTVWADQVSVSYIEVDGKTYTATATVLTGSSSSLSGGWYVVDNNINGTLKFNGDVNIIILDNRSVTITGGDGITVKGNLTIYGQSQGTGSLTIEAKGDNCDGIIAEDGEIKINGGTLNISATRYGICTYGNNTNNCHITINGGRITATGNVNGIDAYKGNITLGYTKPTDCIFANGYGVTNGNTISIASGKILIDGETYYPKNNNTLNPTDLADKILAPNLFGISNDNDGSSEHPFTISSPEGLQLLATYVNSGKISNTYNEETYLYDVYKYTYFKMNSDIGFTSTIENNFTPIGERIGNKDYAFCGTFDGDGHTISGININNNKDYVGLFSSFSKYSVVKNVTLDHANISGGKYIGGIVGFDNYGVITNCLVTNTTISGDNHLGAITGYRSSSGILEYNYYCNSSVNDNKTGVGCDGQDIATMIYNGITYYDGAVSATFLSESEDVPSSLNGKVVFRRVFTGGSASTICLPFDYTPNGSEGTFYTFTGVEKVEGKWEATMNKVDGALTANTPYIIVPDENRSIVPVLFHGDAKYASDPSTQNGNWTFVGTYDVIEWKSAPTMPTYGFSAQAVADDGIYQGQFVKVGTYVKIRPLRAYLQYGSATTRSSLSEEELPDRIMVRLVGSGETSIGQLDLKTGEVTFDDGWYTLEGIRLNGKPTKQGIYVNKGKKYIIK